MAAGPLIATFSTSAFAHGAERGFVMLLPTGHFILGGALAVAISFLIVTVLPGRIFERVYSLRLRLGSIAWPSPVLVSTLSAIILAGLIVIGFKGSRDPLANLLPLTIWTVWWVGLVLLHGIAGHLWIYLNPFPGPYALLDRATDGALSRRPLLIPPAWAAYAPAVFIFLVFAWFQLVAPAPDDPSRLAVAVTVYAIFTFGAVCLFGPMKWLGEHDPFSIVFRLIAAASPVQLTRQEGPDSRTIVFLRMPGAGLAEQQALSLWGIMFVLLTLSSVSFDGFSNTFFWLSLGGINPLDFPGRTAVIPFNSFGLIAAFAALTAIFCAVIFLGWLLAQRRGRVLHLIGTLVLSLVPISIAFHFAHYLPDLLVNGQYVLLAINDPLQSGWNILGLVNYHVTTSFLNTASGSQTIYFIQTLAIVTGHIVGVAVAHRPLLKLGVNRQKLLLLESPIAIFMAAYTAFGLWTLSSPSIG